jgi:hypothetical protein
MQHDISGNMVEMALYLGNSKPKPREGGRMNENMHFRTGMFRKRRTR